jgi:ubiquinone/menaquinone biosynthesis C-methylase UbiE
LSCAGRLAGIVTGVDLGFSGEVVEFYHKYRHGYPDAVIDVLADVFGPSSRDIVVDLGCGTGQLALAWRAPYA